MINLKKLMNLIFLKCGLLMILLSFAIDFSCASKASIIPQPLKLIVLEGNFTLPSKVSCEYSSGCLNEAEYLNNELVKRFNIQNEISSKLPTKVISLKIRHEEISYFGNEGYELKVLPSGVYINAAKPAGIFYGIQSLLQLIGKNSDTKYSVPCIDIYDIPRFSWRAFLLDEARTFQGTAIVKQLLDEMAVLKMNVFHWHLTDDQGWRLEIKKYPELIKINSPETLSEDLMKGDKNGYYSQEQIKEIVKYASQRHITVVPEIEMPGHASAALASYPELGCIGKGYEVATKWGVFEDVYCAGKDNTFDFIENVLDEVIALFPGKYIHIGGDECPKTSWEKCKLCQERMKKENIKDEHQLQSYFIGRIEKYINSKGRSIIGWDEILEGGLAPNATVMSWRGMAGGISAAKANHRVIMTPDEPMYFNYYQYDGTSEPLSAGKLVPIEAVYAYDPVPSELNSEEGKFILGAEACLWSEFIPSPENLEFKAFPRACALSEVLWSAKEGRSFPEFKSRLIPHLARLDNMNVNYARFVLK